MIIVIFTMLIIIVIVFPMGIYSVIFTVSGVIEKLLRRHLTSHL